MYRIEYIHDRHKYSREFYSIKSASQYIRRNKLKKIKWFYNDDQCIMVNDKLTSIYQLQKCINNAINLFD